MGPRVAPFTMDRAQEQPPLGDRQEEGDSKSLAAHERSDWLFDPLGTALGWLAERIVRSGKVVGKKLSRRLLGPEHDPPH